MNPPVLTIKKLSFAYGPSAVLTGVDLVVDPGDFVALVGPNGAGKSTLIKLLLGLLTPTQGEITWWQTPLAKFKDWHRLGYLPQRVNAFNPLFPATVGEVVAMGLLAQKKLPKHFSTVDQQPIKKALQLLAIEDLINQSVNELSGGQQQRVFLARALVGQPAVLILDEPSAALDPASRQSFFAILQQLNQEQGLTIIMVTHDTAQAGQFANKLVYLDRTVVFAGAFADFCHSSDMEKYFGAAAQHLICHQHD